MHLYAQLTVKAGPDQGRTIDVPADGVGLGRSSGNDVTLADPLLSRHHCRLGFTSRGELLVSDLDSANGTLVNGEPVGEQILATGDRIVIGNTELVVTAVAAGLPTGEPAEGAAADGKPPGADGGAASPPVFVDLGFNDPESAEHHAPSMRPLLWAIGAAALLLLGVALIMRLPGRPPAPPVRPPAGQELLPMEITYEKVEASSNSIFRYAMTLDASMRLAVAIDDLAENRHVRKEAVVATNLVRELARELDASGFFHLADTYEGIPRADILNTWAITIVQGTRVKQCRVANRIEPDDFQTVRERLETFGKNELGIWAIQFSRDRLVALADEAFTRARNTFDERGIAYGNTAEAIRRFREAAFYLETVEPKPDFHGELVSLLAQAEEELDRRYEEQRFLADRAVNLKEWSSAARELRILREMIPDRNDPRHIQATRKLLDVENRIKTKGKP